MLSRHKLLSHSKFANLRNGLLECKYSINNISNTNTIKNKYNDELTLFSYKILTPIEYNTFVNTGNFHGNHKDTSKEYISMSKNHEQLKKVILTDYNNQIVYVCKFTNTKLPYLKYHEDLDGDLHPCLFQTLYLSSMIKSFELHTDTNNYSYYHDVINNLSKYI